MHRRTTIFAIPVLALVAMSVFFAGVSLHSVDNVCSSQTDTQHCANHCSCPKPVALNTIVVSAAPRTATEAPRCSDLLQPDTGLPSSIFIPPRA